MAREGRKGGGKGRSEEGNKVKRKEERCEENDGEGKFEK